MLLRVSSASALVLRISALSKKARDGRASFSFAWCCYCFRCLLDLPCLHPPEDIHHEDEEDRHEEDGENRCRNHAAHHASTDGALAARACPRGDRQRQNAEREG